MGTIRKIKRGVFMMARDAGYPVVPIAVQGNFEINQKGSKLFRPRGKLMFMLVHKWKRWAFKS